jgi:hypothetical protein
MRAKIKMLLDMGRSSPRSKTFLARRVNMRMTTIREAII